MATIDENLRSWLIGNPALNAIVGGRVHVNHIPEESELTYAWIGRASIQDEETLDQVPGGQPFREVFDLEIHGSDIAKVAEAAELVRAKSTYRGAFGSGSIQGVFVREHADDYLLRGVMNDDGIHDAALELELIGHQS